MGEGENNQTISKVVGNFQPFNFRMSAFLKALSVFCGTIIGVGIFGLPYVASKAGFLPIIGYFLLMSCITIIIHLFYGEVAAGTKGFHRLPGYVGKYLGNNWKKFAFLITGLGFFGSLLAYLIIGGEFLTHLFGPFFGGNTLIYTFLFFSIGTCLIFQGTKSISQIEFFLLLLFFAILVLFFIKALPFINLAHLKTFNWEFLTLPYGVILFALWGSALIPEMKEIVQGDPHYQKIGGGISNKILRKVIISGILISALTYLFFIFIIFGASGVHTSQDAISGLAQTLGDGVIRLGFIFGIITCFTSFITLGLTLKKIFWYDLGLSKNFSWFIACFFPFFLFLIGLREFIKVISFTGSFALGCNAIIIIFLYRAFLAKKFGQKMNPFLIYSLVGFFILGILFETIYFLR